MPKETKIPKVRFNLKSHDPNTQANEEILIILVYRYNGNRILYSTGEKVISKYWDKNKQRAKSVKGYYQEYRELNERLKYYEELVTEIYVENDFGDISLDKFKKLIANGNRKRKPKVKGKPTLFQFIEQFIEERKARGSSNKKRWDKFPGVYEHLRNYAKEKRIKLDYDSIDWKFKADFETWLYQPPRNHSINNASKVLQVVKQFMHEALRREYHTNTKFQQTGFAIKRVKVKNKIRLNPNEVKTIMQYDFSEKPFLDKVRDMFIAACFSGLRISDWGNINRSHLIDHNGRLFIQLMMAKTKNVVYIPVMDELLVILKKYDYELPTMASQVFNRSIKEVLKLAIPDSTFLRVYSEGGTVKDEIAPKWKFVSSHAGRRTFASNRYMEGWALRTIKNILGHASEAQTEEYMDISDLELADREARLLELQKVAKTLNVVRV